MAIRFPGRWPAHILANRLTRRPVLPADRYRTTSRYGARVCAAADAARHGNGAARTKRVARDKSRGAEAQGVGTLEVAPATLDDEGLTRLENGRRYGEGDGSTIEGLVDALVQGAETGINVGLVRCIGAKNRCAHV